MAFTAKILPWRFRQLNIVGCLLKRRPTKGGSRGQKKLGPRPTPFTCGFPPPPHPRVTTIRLCTSLLALLAQLDRALPPFIAEVGIRFPGTFEPLGLFIYCEDDFHFNIFIRSSHYHHHLSSSCQRNHHTRCLPIKL